MKVSVITSTYREYGSLALQRAISSVQNQNYQDWEMIIVGDCTPFSRQINVYLAELNDKRIKFINLPKRAGTSSPGTVPKIEGTRQALGEYLCFLDADNLFFPDHLKKCVTAFRNNPSLDLVYSDTLIKRAKRQNKKSDWLSFIWRKPDWDDKRKKLILHSNFLDMSETVFTRKAYDDAGGLDTKHQSSDWTLWKKMIKSGHDNFQHLHHMGLVYHTTNVRHHLQYFILMLTQNIGLRYQSDKMKFVQRGIKKRFAKKHN